MFSNSTQARHGPNDVHDKSSMVSTKKKYPFGSVWSKQISSLLTPATSNYQLTKQGNRIITWKVTTWIRARQNTVYQDLWVDCKCQMWKRWPAQWHFFPKLIMQDIENCVLHSRAANKLLKKWNKQTYDTTETDFPDQHITLTKRRIKANN